MQICILIFNYRSMYINRKANFNTIFNQFNYTAIGLGKYYNKNLDFT